MDDNKRTPGGRDNSRRNNNNRPRREGNAPQPANRGSNAQPKFDPHFVSAPEATPLRPVKKAPAAQPAAKQTAPVQNGQRQRGGQPARAEQRTDRNDPRTEQRAERNSRNARPAQNSQSQQGSRNNRNAVPSSRPASMMRTTVSSTRYVSAPQLCSRTATATAKSSSSSGLVTAVFPLLLPADSTS